MMTKEDREHCMKLCKVIEDMAELFKNSEPETTPAEILASYCRKYERDVIELKDEVFQLQQELLEANRIVLMHEGTIKEQQEIIQRYERAIKKGA